MTNRFPIPKFFGGPWPGGRKLKKSRLIKKRMKAEKRYWDFVEALQEPLRHGIISGSVLNEIFQVVAII